MAEMKKYRFIHVGLDAAREMHAGKPVYYVFNNRSNEAIARILWYAPWRLWVATFSEESVWSAGCLADIQDAIKWIGEQVNNG